MTLAHFKDVEKAIALLSSMVEGGEAHSEQSRQAVKLAFQSLEEIQTTCQTVKEIRLEVTRSTSYKLGWNDLHELLSRKFDL